MGIDHLLGKIHNVDCLPFMRSLPDKCVDLVLTDPPYGKMWTRGKNSIGTVKDVCEDDKTLWDKVIPVGEIFTQIMRVSKYQIIFGGNYFTEFLPPSNCWIIWDKLADHKVSKEIPFAHCEMAWTSFNTTVKKYTLRQQGFISDTKDKREHPTQKPSELFGWIINDYCEKKELETVFDPFMGSGTTAVACERLGRKWFGCELEPKYCEIANKRIEAERAQLKLF